MMKQCYTRTDIVNRSLSSGKFPKSMKNVLVNPLINRSSLDPSEYKNDRPISNLRFVSKVIERVVANQLKSYHSVNNLDDELHSAYRRKHSTETAPLKAVSDIRSCIDQDQSVILMLLDLGVAFDSVYCDILVGRLAYRLGIKGVLLQWLNLYLRTHTQTAAIMNAISVLSELSFEVP